MLKYFLILFAAVQANADLVIKANVYSKGEKCAMESITGLDGSYMNLNCPQGEMIYKYDVKSQTLLMKTKGSKQCMKLTKKQMQQMAAVQDQLKMLPPEQRKMLEASLGKAGVPMIPKLTATARKEKVKQWTCQVFDQTLNGKKVGEECHAPSKDVGLDAAKYKRVMDFVEEMSKLASGQQGSDSFKLFRQGLVVVQAKSLENGKMSVSFDLEKVSEESGRYASTAFPANCAAR